MRRVAKGPRDDVAHILEEKLLKNHLSVVCMLLLSLALMCVVGGAAATDVLHAQPSKLEPSEWVNQQPPALPVV